MKSLLLIGAGAFQVKTIKNLSENGFEIIAADGNASAPGFAYSSRSECIDIRSKDKIYELAKKLNPDGIMPMNDFATRSAFYASQKMGLHNPTYLSGICANDKGIMREIWSHEEILQPRHMVLTHLLDDSSGIDFSYPFIVKPADSGGGGRGISICYSGDDFKKAQAHAFQHAMRNRILIEEFVNGTEVTVESLIYRGEVINLTISDKVKADSKYRVATSLNFPSFYDDAIVSRIYSKVTLAIEALGIIDGAAHTELIISEDLEKIWLIETGLRGGGGHVFSTIIEEVTGVNAPLELAKICCGMDPKINVEKKSHCTYRFFNPEERGILKNVNYASDLPKSDGVLDFGITLKKGDRFDGLVDSMHRVGYVVTRGTKRAESIQRANLIEKNISFNFEN